MLRNVLMFAQMNRSHTVCSADPLVTRPPSADYTKSEEFFFKFQTHERFTAYIERKNC